MNLFYEFDGFFSAKQSHIACCARDDIGHFPHSLPPLSNQPSTALIEWKYILLKLKWDIWTKALHGIRGAWQPYNVSHIVSHAPKCVGVCFVVDIYFLLFCFSCGLLCVDASFVKVYNTHTHTQTHTPAKVCGFKFFLSPFKMMIANTMEKSTKPP